MENVISTVAVKDKQLHIIYNKLEYGLHKVLSSDSKIEDYIKRDTDAAYIEAISQEDDNTFVLNIASTQDFGYFEWHQMPGLLQRQLDIFLPIIQKFMVDAIT